MVCNNCTTHECKDENNPECPYPCENESSEYDYILKMAVNAITRLHGLQFNIKEK